MVVLNEYICCLHDSANGTDDSWERISFLHDGADIWISGQVPVQAISKWDRVSLQGHPKQKCLLDSRLLLGQDPRVGSEAVQERR